MISRFCYHCFIKTRDPCRLPIYILYMRLFRKNAELPSDQIRITVNLQLFDFFSLCLIIDAVYILIISKAISVLTGN